MPVMLSSPYNAFSGGQISVLPLPEDHTGSSSSSGGFASHGGNGSSSSADGGASAGAGAGAGSSISSSNNSGSGSSGNRQSMAGRGKVEKRKYRAGHSETSRSTSPSSSSSPSPAVRSGRGRKPPHELLSEAQKKANHIASEQKRRANIRIGFDQLVDIVPTLTHSHRSESVILHKSADYIRQLVNTKNTLRERVRELQTALGDMPDEDSSEGEMDYPF
ncbi:hypothetical protein BX666DRAFT_1929698 [Dichotomocladium elegans]|nr:hypothetical protein BX666DRAFT_1929698 [Dichotomocladium elegans]